MTKSQAFSLVLASLTCTFTVQKAVPMYVRLNAPDRAGVGVMSLPSFWPLAASHKICGHGGAAPLHLHRLTPPTQRDSAAWYLVD